MWQRVVDVFAPAHVVEFFATTDGHAVLANVSGAKIGSKGRPLPGAGRVELGAYDAEHDLILENERGLVRVPDTNEVGVLLGEPRGPIDPTASVKRGVFGPADTWISTEYLFRRDVDGDFLAGGQVAVRRSAPERGVVFCEPITDAARAHSGGRPRGDLRSAEGRTPSRGDRGEINVTAGCDDHGGGSHRGSGGGDAVPGWDPTSCMWWRRLTLSASYRPTVSRVAGGRDSQGGTPCLVFRR